MIKYEECMKIIGVNITGRILERTILPLRSGRPRPLRNSFFRRHFDDAMLLGDLKMCRHCSRRNRLEEERNEMRSKDESSTLPLSLVFFFVV